LATILLFGPVRTAASEPLDAAGVAEDAVEGMIQRCDQLRINTGDCAALMTLDLVARLCAYSRADLPAVLQALAMAVPAREELLRHANEAGEPAPPLGAAKLAIVTARRLH
jgi:hypothetical protein